jgi:hypothetical protein
MVLALAACFGFALDFWALDFWLATIAFIPPAACFCHYRSR